MTHASIHAPLWHTKTSLLPLATKFRSQTAYSPFRIIRSFPSFAATAPGRDIWAASERVFDAAVEKAYGGKKKIAWFEVFAGEASKTKFDNWLPDDTVEAFKEFLVGIKGPLTTPVGGGIRSLNVALRQMLDLYVCLRPVQYFKGVPSPGEASGEGRHGHLPREHRGHLRRHRFRGRQRTGAQDPRLPQGKFPEGIQENPLRRGATRLGRHRHQAGLAARHGAPRARGDQVRHRPEEEVGHDRPQGQHHEVHRRRVPRLGLRPGQEGIRRGRDRRRPVVQAARTASSSRTPSPTSRSSRC